MITHSNLGMKQEWKTFVNNLPYTVEFLHRDEFVKLYPNNPVTSFPAVFKETGAVTLLLTKDEINAVHEIRDLKQLIISKLNERKAQ